MSLSWKVGNRVVPEHQLWGECNLQIVEWPLHGIELCCHCSSLWWPHWHLLGWWHHVLGGLSDSVQQTHIYWLPIKSQGQHWTYEGHRPSPKGAHSSEGYYSKELGTVSYSDTLGVLGQCRSSYSWHLIWEAGRKGLLSAQSKLPLRREIRTEKIHCIHHLKCVRIFWNSEKDIKVFVFCM